MSCLPEFHSLRQISLTEMMFTRETDESGLCSFRNVFKMFVKNVVEKEYLDDMDVLKLTLK